MNIVRAFLLLCREHFKLKLLVLQTRRDVGMLAKQMTALIAALGAADTESREKTDRLLAQQAARLAAEIEKMEYVLANDFPSEDTVSPELEKLIRELQKERKGNEPGENKKGMGTEE